MFDGAITVVGTECATTIPFYRQIKSNLSVCQSVLLAKTFCVVQRQVASSQTILDVFCSQLYIS